MILTQKPQINFVVRLNDAVTIYNGRLPIQR